VAVFCLGTVVSADRQKPAEPKDPGTVVRVAAANFRKMHERGEVLVVDVRDAEAFQAGHIPGAIGVPLADVERRVQEIKTKAGTKPVVTYCSCPSEHTSAQAGWILYTHGVKDVRALVGGYIEWVRSGGRIERSTFQSASPAWRGCEAVNHVLASRHDR
jgi:rhodanese-related sulfurtransferase